MGFIYGIIKRVVKFSIYLSIILTLIVVIPNIPPHTSFTSIKHDPALPREGPLAPNGDLNNAEKLFVDKLLGPEAFYIHKGELYTSLATGEIVKISPGGHLTFVTKIGQPCPSLVYEHICGRPLGFEIDEKNDALYVADAYHGIWKVDLKTDKKQLLVSPRLEIKDAKPMLFNSLALAKNGDIYWTDSSSDFHLNDGSYIPLVDPSGRFFHYNAATNHSIVLIDKLWFANGVVLSPNNDFALVLETARFRILKHYIDGPKKGQTEVFITGLPGTPDNIRAVPDGSGVLVGLYTTYDEKDPMLIRSMGETPLVRKLLARVQRLAEIPFEYLNTIYPHVLFDDIIYHIGHITITSGVLPKQSGLLYLDWNGNIISSHYNNDGSLGHISEAIVYNDRLYTGSPQVQNYIGSVPIPPILKKAFQAPAKPSPAKNVEAAKPKEEKLKVETKKEAPKPVVQEKPVQKQTKPVETEKPVQKQTKPVETEKPKPPAVENKPAAPKPTEQPKPATTPPPPKVQPKQEAKPTPKPEVKTTPPPTKPEAKTAPPPSEPPVKTTPPPPTKPVKPVIEQVKTTTYKPEVKKSKEEKPAKAAPKAAGKPEQIPIKEEIPSDTVKPSKETLKVIKKGGPTEIPNPNL